MLHVCRDHNLLDLLLDYPVAMFNWDDHGAGNPSLADVAARTQATVVGGVNRELVRSGTPEQVAAQVSTDLARAGTTRLLMAGGCGIAYDAAPANLEAVAAAVRA
jgi:uroporphyrinogen decarboxylase